MFTHTGSQPLKCACAATKQVAAICAHQKPGRKRRGGESFFHRVLTMEFLQYTMGGAHASSECLPSSTAAAVRPDDVSERVRFCCWRARHASIIGRLSSSSEVLLRRVLPDASRIAAARRCSRTPTTGVSALADRRSVILAFAPGSEYRLASRTPAAASSATLSRSAFRASIHSGPAVLDHPGQPVPSADAIDTAHASATRSRTPLHHWI